ncbi:MAG: Crp/Fnr family transcriptional regulator [Rhodospirillales bacterium]|nr:Crp/Fnr family transcriptional regulator [Rhodospirillales bacterium]
MAELDTLKFYSELSKDAQALLQKRLVRRTLHRGRAVIEKGHTVSGAYFVLHGQLRVYTFGPGGKEATLYFIRPGETCVLALNSLFNDLLYPAWVEAAADTVVGIVPGQLYRTLFERERGIQDLTVRALSTAVFRLMAELEEVHTTRLDQRLAAFLLTHASSEGLVLGTQQELAHHIGTTREVVARQVGEWVASGLVETGRGRLRLLDLSALAKCAKAGSV